MKSDRSPAASVDEDQITRMVQLFYDSARDHPDLGPLFNASIVDWERHLAIVRDFWSHALLRTDRYRGHPYPAHLGLAIRREHFEQWLELFRRAARESLSTEGSARAIARAEHMTESFKAGLFPFDPLPPKMQP